jgi:hypothetical protein
MNEHIPSLSSIVDSITARMEATHDQAEYEALREALAVIEAHVFRDQRTVNLIERVLARLGRHDPAQRNGVIT